MLFQSHSQDYIALTVATGQCKKNCMRLTTSVIWLGFIPAMLASTQVIAQNRSFGVWRNPSNSVHMRAEPCDQSMCGVIVWANEKAKADALKGSDEPLVGSRLFREFKQERAGVWRGKVFVPDIGKTFSGTITILDENRIQARGCLVGRIGCKSQVWVRVHS